MYATAREYGEQLGEATLEVDEPRDGGEGSDPEVGEPLVSDPSSVAALL